jgi:hypothetical protein
MKRVLSRLQRSVISRPLSVILAVLLMLLPTYPGFERTTVVGASQAAAQVVTNTIIQNYCVAGTCYINDLSQLESDAVNAALGMHDLRSSAAAVIYTYGRTDLRDSIRGQIVTILLGIINTPASQRSTHQQNLYNWLQALVQHNEIAEYTQALNQFELWQSNPCMFTLDPTIAKQYSLSYDGTPFCFGGSLNSSFSGPSVPAESYFTAYGLLNSYGAPAATFRNFGAIVRGTAVNVAEVVGISAAAGALILAAAGVALTAIFTATAALLATGVAAGGFAVAGALVSASTVAALGTVFLVAGPLAIIVIAIEIGVTAGMQAFNNQKTIDDLNNLNNTLAQVTNTPPDLMAFASDPSGLGMYKLENTIDAATVPEVASTATLPRHQDSDLNFAIQTSTQTSPTITQTLAYQDWNGVDWSAQTYGGWFVQTCTSGANCPQADSITADIQYVDGSGVKWTAARFGNDFISVQNNLLSTLAPCPADPATGVSGGTNFSNCSSYVSTSIPLQDPNGVLETVSFSVLSPPTFGAVTTLPFTPGVASTQTITVSGNPTPQICVSSSSPSLPSPDFSLNGGNCGTGTFQLAFNGDASSPTQTYQLTLSATNGNTTSPVQQTFNIVVAPQLMITSPAQLDGVAGFPVNFLVTTTGSPAPSLSISSGLLPDGLTFTDNGNGTATISGVPSFSISNECINNCGITASSTQGTVTQLFAINLAAAPAASLGPPTSATFIAGVPSSVTLSSIGASTPVSWSFPLDYAPPSWLNLTDNGNGTATLRGTPPLDTTTTLQVQVCPFALGSSFTECGSPATFPLTVSNIPVFRSPTTSSFTVGTQGTFDALVNQGSVGLVQTLPAGLSLAPLGSLQCFTSNVDGVCITGTPAIGTGGQYNLTLTDNAGAAGSATQSLTMNIYEGPQITSANSAVFFTGMPGSFAVTTTGFPSLSTQPVAANEAPPTSPAQGEGMFFTVTGLPSDLQFSNLDPEGLATGTLTIQGTPSAGDTGMHPVQITAQNGVGAIAQQTLALNIIKITGAAPVSGTTCNGAYNGTFSGNVVIRAGQNCMFVGGGITGNVTVNGGNLDLTNANVSGNLAVQGSTGFSLGPDATISGNLSIQNIASGVTMNQICGTRVAGNVKVSANATPLEIGSSADVSCPGNSFGQNVSVTNNTAATGFYNNTIRKNLSCSSNTSITGAGDTAATKNGQCATF